MIVFSTDSSQVLGGPTAEMHILNTDGTGELVLVSASPTIPFPNGEAWSADGQQIAFSSDGCDIGSVSDLYRIRPDGGNLTILVRNSPGWACIWAPYWSPDGSRLLASHHFYSGPSGLLLLDASTGQGSELYGQGAPSWTYRSAWSPDGAVVAFLGSPTDPFGALYLSSPAGASRVLIQQQVTDMVFLR
jgi:Tol biopolymer transport system component